MGGQKDRQEECQTDRWTKARWIERKTDRKKVKQTDRQRYKSINGWTER
jgi:hypothetical protein